MKLVLLFSLLVLTFSRIVSFKPGGPLSNKRAFITHPEPKGSKINQPNGPYPTNTWYQHFLTGDGSNPVQCNPLTMSFKEGLVQISSQNFNKDVTDTNYRYSMFIPDWEFNHGIPLKVTDFKELYVTWSGQNINIPVVQGMPFFTAELNNIGTVLKCYSEIWWGKSSTGVFNLGQKTAPSNWFMVQVGSGQFWVLYSSTPISIYVDRFSIVIPPIAGFVRFGCTNFKDITEQLLPFLGKYPVGGVLDYSFLPNNRYQLKFQYTTKGNGELLMMAFPHHFDTLVNPLLFDQLKFEHIKGSMIGVKGQTWVFEGPLVSLSWDAPRSMDADKIGAIKASLKQDMNLPLPDDWENPYWFGLKLAKFARLAVIADELLMDTEAAALRSKIKNKIIQWFEGTNADSLYYDTTYGGIVSKWGISDKNADYGQGYYNDHYYHYGYFIYCIAAVVKKDLNFYSQYENQILDFVQDVANPDWNDKFYTVTRHKDWFAGHSWANGILSGQDNRNQESVSEAYNCYYSVYLLGLAINNQDMKNFGNLLLTTEIISTKKYWQMPSNSTIYPAKFAQNKMVGILFSNKVEYNTWFGWYDQFMHGIQMIPFLPITELTLDKYFVQEEYPVLTRNGVQVEEWRVFNIMDLAIIDKQSAWNQATTYDKWAQTHPSQTKTHTLWWIASRP